MNDALVGGELRLHDVRKTYSGQRGVERVDLDVKSGEFLTMLGPSGSGKTTTLNLIAGFLDADEGSITLDGRELSGVPPHKRGLGMVFQNYALFPHMSAADNVAYPLRVRGIKGAEQRRLVSQALAMVQLEEYADRRPTALSGGQQQRVALARSFVFQPRLLLMDEPLGALDKKLRETLQIEISRICRELGATVIYVTHDQEEALAMSDHIAIYNHGRIEQIGTAEELYRRPNSLFVADFVGESTVLRGTRSNGCLHYGDETLAAAAPEAAVSASGRAALVLRPENLRVFPASAAGQVPEGFSTLRTTVVDWVYLGVARKCLLRDKQGATVTARVAAGHDISELGTGREAIVAWDPADAVLVPDP
ncbi:putative spermidine/putrescine transport system ATP-binding protein [Amycolatopsis marina]|uniref:Putative spermidine/putrescine transport system ATP-binding protein n=1 Tax=Amycolatopsis marina TaxID=490629 RepID=A0A1I0XXM9_9PSEU|nr:ABC transporter ATP-binding protein [Amycolatopsis marina]SFB05050.1 putative spermidine/putrescine transport system ATP-binding protein [Amycolatopsis marina]